MSIALEEALTTLGLNRYEVKAYLALLVRGTATVSEIADLSGIPYTRAYDTLVSLQNKGLVASIPGRPMKFYPLEPEVALRSLLERKREEVLAELRRLEVSVNQALNMLKQHWSKTRIEESLVVVVKGEHASLNLLLETLSKAPSGEAFLICSDLEVIPEKMLSELTGKGVVILEKKTDENVCIALCPGALLIYNKGTTEEYSNIVVLKSAALAELLIEILKKQT